MEVPFTFGAQFLEVAFRILSNFSKLCAVESMNHEPFAKVMKPSFCCARQINVDKQLAVMTTPRNQ